MKRFWRFKRRTLSNRTRKLDGPLTGFNSTNRRLQGALLLEQFGAQKAHPFALRIHSHLCKRVFDLLQTLSERLKQVGECKDLGRTC